jgi:hypothetical protein
MAFDLATARPEGSGFDLTSAKPIKAERSMSLTDPANAAATGYNQGLLRLAGLPVDTVANVIDLGKAAIGAPYQAITGKPAPDYLIPGDRSKVVGSGEYLINQARQAAPSMVDPQNPDMNGGYWQAGGSGLTAIINPNSRAQLVNQGLLGVTGALLPHAVKDAGGSDAAAITAGLLPLGVQRGSAEAVKRAIRGGEAGRVAMEQRVADLRAAGIDNPTVGLASGSPLIGGVENLLQNAPGAVGIMRRAREGSVNALMRTVDNAASTASSNRGAVAAGSGIQSGARTFGEDFKGRQNQLYNALDQYIPGWVPADVNKTTSTLAQLNQDIPGAPQLSKQFKNARIMAIEDAVKSDAGSTPLVVNGVPAAPTNTLPFEAVKKLRTLVGGEIADNSLMSDVPRSKWNPLYGALSEDMGTASTQAGPQATAAFNRATDYTRSGIGRMERIAPIVDRPAPEQSYTALAQTLNENTSTFQAVKKSLPEGVRGQVAGTVIERLGKATNGTQNDAGTVWNPETFLTNWNKMTPQGRKELLSGFPNSDAVRRDIEAVAKATSMMRDNSRIWSNPSGTAANAAARGTIGAIGVGGLGALSGMVSPVVPLGAAAAVIGANFLGRSLTNKRFVNELMRPDLGNPQLDQAQFNALAASGLLGQNR